MNDNYAIIITLNENVSEIVDLADSLDYNIVKSFVQHRKRPDVNSYIGSGKIEEIKEFIKTSEKIITLVIRLEFVYYILLILFQFLTNSPLSTFWVLFMFLYHLLGFLGNERYRIINTRKVKSDNSPGWKRYLLLVVIAALDLLEFYILVTFLYKLNELANYILLINQ